jgi:alkylated DNA repair dioxygenase AlkB
MEKVELRFGAWYQYQENWVSEQKTSDLHRWLVENMAWEERVIYAFGKEIIQPRLMSWCGDIPYKYSGQILPPASIPKPLMDLLEPLQTLCDTPFNHIVLNRYRDRQDHMSMHADNEPELGRNPIIAALSLGTERVFHMLPKARKGRYKHQRKLKLSNGSLLVMGGRMQHSWRHAVPKSKSANGERINITFRYLRGEPGWRDTSYLAYKNNKPGPDGDSH